MAEKENKKSQEEVKKAAGSADAPEIPVEEAEASVESAGSKGQSSLAGAAKSVVSGAGKVVTSAAGLAGATAGVAKGTAKTGVKIAGDATNAATNVVNQVPGGTTVTGSAKKLVDTAVGASKGTVDAVLSTTGLSDAKAKRGPAAVADTALAGATETAGAAATAATNAAAVGQDLAHRLLHGAEDLVDAAALEGQNLFHSVFAKFGRSKRR